MTGHELTALARDLAVLEGWLDDLVPPHRPRKAPPRPSGDEPFTQVLERTIRRLNDCERYPEALAPQIRRVIARLADIHIVPRTSAGPRRYFAEQSYFCSDGEPRRRFLFRALDSLFRIRGYEAGWDDPRVSHVRADLEDALREFGRLEVVPAWGGPSAAGLVPDIDQFNQGALRICRTLVRLFYVEGLAANLLSSWQNYERFIYAVAPGYRDHFAHLLYDFMVGAKLIDNLIDSIRNNWTIHANEEISLDELHVRLMRSWVIAALFHDIGYAAERLGVFRNRLQQEFFAKIPGCDLGPLELHRREYLEHETDSILTLLSYIFTEDEFSFDFETFREFERNRYYPESLIFGAINSLLRDQLQEHDHGVMSALFLMLSLKVDVHEFTAEFRDGEPRAARRDRFRRERAHLMEDVSSGVLAIALHNLRERAYPGITLDFRTHPIAFLLLLCDTMQEWDREPDRAVAVRRISNAIDFLVFPRLAEPRSLLRDTNSHARGDDTYTMPTLSAHMLAQLSKSADAAECLSRLRTGLSLLHRRACRTPPDDADSLRFLLEEIVAAAPPMGAADVARLRGASCQLVGDVISITYVGGDPAIRGRSDDCVVGLWDQLARLFGNNLSSGPAFVAFHGYQEEHVELFFVASYSPANRVYMVEKALRP